MKYFLHFTFWLLLFSGGLLELLGVPSTLFKPVFPFIAFTLFAHIVLSNLSHIKLPAIVMIMLFLAIATISGIVNGMGPFAVLYFLVFMLYPVMYFYVIVNDDSLNINVLVKFIVALVFIQIPAAAVKFFVWGISEDGPLGTIVKRGSSVSAIFPLFVISFLLPLFFKTNKKRYLVFIALFAAVGLIGNKRSLFLTLPLLIAFAMVTFLHSTSYHLMKKTVKSWAFSILGVIGLIYVIIILIPSLNPEHKIGGSFDPAYVYNYTVNYMNPDEDRFTHMRRMDGIVYFTSYTLNSLKTSLVGDGPGKLISSIFIEGDGSMLQNYGIRYGGRMGFVWMMLQVGIVGLIIYLLIYAKIHLTISNKFRNAEKNILYFAYLNILFVFSFDFFFYSTVSIQTDLIYCLYFFAFALIYKSKKIELFSY